MSIMGDADVVARVLRQAAERAERLAVLDTAQATIEKLLNYPMPPESLPWGHALFFV